MTDAKEVGVGNPAGRNVLSPDYHPYDLPGHLRQPINCHSLTLYWRSGRPARRGVFEGATPQCQTRRPPHYLTVQERGIRAGRRYIRP